MKLLNIILKSLKEQMRSYWLLLLSVLMGPFFIFVYYLITESSSPDYRLLVINNDAGTTAGGKLINHGSILLSFIDAFESGSTEVPFRVKTADDRNKAAADIKNRKADALVILDPLFSQAIEARKSNDTSLVSRVEFEGDLTSTSYLICAVWANEILNEYVMQSTGTQRVIQVKETALGTSGAAGEFDMMVPGILIVSLIMLMFTASIAFVSEVENKTIIRLKLSRLTATGFLGGISIVQLMVGILSVLLTLLTAVLLGFKYSGSLLTVILVASLTSLSIIAFSLIIAAVTKSAGEVLVVGNFPMFLFMFFTGAAFPLKSNPLFTVAGYPFSIQGVMTPTHAVSALNKTLIMDMGMSAILPEIVMIIVLTAIYFAIGGIMFRRRHLKLT
jgi:ABC-2 type transport system permease protein